MASLSEALARQFHEWESRGRGWHLGDKPLCLEPPYRQCTYYRPGGSSLSDDGRRHTVLSRAIAAVSGLWRSRPDNNHVLELPEEPGPFSVEPVPLLECEITLPRDRQISKGVCEQLLLNLGSCAFPLVFEIVGTPDEVSIQFTCAERDALQLKQQLRAHVPEVRLETFSGKLSWLWDQAGESESLVVEFGLSEAFMRPLKTFRSFDPEPLTGIIAALSDLHEQEIGVFQVLFEPARNPWAESIFYAVTNDSGTSLFADSPELVGLAREKTRSPLYAVMVRAAAKSRYDNGALQIVQDIAAALRPFSNPASNEFMPLANDGYPDDVHDADMLARVSRRTGMLLNADELVGLVHLPDYSLPVEKFKRTDAPQQPTPAIAHGHSLVLGANHTDAGIELVTLSDEQRLKHTYVIGASGTGKSTFLLNLIVQDMDAGRGLALLDPHGDLVEEVLGRVPAHRLEDVIIFDPADDGYAIGFNILSAHSEQEKSLIASDLVAVFRRLSTSWGDQMTTVFNNAVLAMIESGIVATLADLRRFLVEKPFRERFLEHVADKEVVYYWRREFPMLSGKPQVPILTRLDAFLRPKHLRHMVVQRETRLHFGKALNSGKIFLAKLSQGAIGEENAYLLGSLLIAKFNQTALSRQSLDAESRRPFYLYVDEFQNFITPSMAALLSGARKYKVGLVLAHQELRQVEKRDPEVLSAALSNAFTRICFRVGEQDARKLAEGFLHFDPAHLQTLSTGEAVARVERADYDFRLYTSPPDEIDGTAARAIREAAIRLSRQRYATPREEVERQLEAAWSEGLVPESVPASQPAPPDLAVPAVKINEPDVLETSSPAPAVEKRTSATRRRAPPPIPASLGKGGQQHKYLQQLIKRWAEGMGYRATIERPAKDARGSIDIWLEKDQVAIACEISVTTSPQLELDNLRKCLTEPCTYIVSVAAETSKLTAVSRLANAELSEEELARVRFVTPEELFLFIESLEAERAGRVETVRGYKVKVNYTALDGAEREARKKAVARTLASTLKRSSKK